MNISNVKQTFISISYGFIFSHFLKRTFHFPTCQKLQNIRIFACIYCNKKDYCRNEKRFIAVAHKRGTDPAD